MNYNLIAILIFFVVMVALFWIMTDRAANRVTKSLTSLMQMLPISNVAKLITNCFKNSKK